MATHRFVTVKGLCAPPAPCPYHPASVDPGQISSSVYTFVSSSVKWNWGKDALWVFLAQKFNHFIFILELLIGLCTSVTFNIGNSYQLPI